jgi:hypothetical protein
MWLNRFHKALLLACEQPLGKVGRQHRSARPTRERQIRQMRGRTLASVRAAGSKSGAESGEDALRGND